jgi:hypothetical protein
MFKKKIVLDLFAFLASRKTGHVVQRDPKTTFFFVSKEEIKIKNFFIIFFQININKNR